LVAGLVAAWMGLALCLPASAWAAGEHRSPALGAIVIPAIGFGYTVTSQGPLDAAHFPAGSPSASAAAGALNSLGGTVETYQRSWQDAEGVNQVQDLVVRFSTTADAASFVAAARRALANGEIVSSGPLPSVPGSERATYFASTNQAGVGQTVTVRVGDYAAVLSFFSAASGNSTPITTTSAERVAKTQYAALVSATSPMTVKSQRAGGSIGAVGWTALALAVLAVVVATLLALRRRVANDRKPLEGTA
jgi:hypothetical protein